MEGEIEKNKQNTWLVKTHVFLPFSPLSSSLSLRYEPLLRRSSLSSLATVYALDMPGQGASPRPRRRGTGSPGALESYGFLALAAVDWLREKGLISPLSPLCAFGHSGGGLAALSAEQERPGTFRAVRRRGSFFFVCSCHCPGFFVFHALILLFSLSPPPPSLLFYKQLYLFEPVVLTAANPPQRNRGEEASASSPSSPSSPPSPPPFALSSTPSLEAGARRRRRAFGSREAALLSLRRKPPFSLFDAECAQIYAEEGMIDETEGEEGDGGDERGRMTTTTAAAAASASSFPTFSPSPSSSTPTATSLTADTPVSLAASPEDEAAVYLEAGPLGVEAGRKLGAVAAPVLVAAGGDGDGDGAKSGGASSGGDRGATRPNPSLHAPLARAAPRTARLLPRGRLEVYHGLGHLGPFEKPGFVGERAAEAFARAVTEERESWRSLPPQREFELGSSLSAKL